MIYTLIVIGVLFCLTFIFGSFTNKKPSKNINLINQENIYSQINSKDIKSKQKFISRDYSNALVVDEENNLHIFYNKYKNEDDTFNINYVTYPSSKLIESEIIIDGQTVEKTSRSSQLKGMVVGGLLLGGVGAIVGGLSGDKLSHETIKKIDMKLTVEDINNPVYTINFLNNIDLYTKELIKNGYNKDSGEVKSTLTNANKWHGIMDVLIRQQNKESVS